MRHLRTFAAAVATGAASLAFVAGTSPGAAAAPASTPLAGGRTTVTVAAGTAAALLSHGIVPLPYAPGVEFPVVAGPTLGASFPIDSGSVNLSSLTGVIGHAGGLIFFDTVTQKSVLIRTFEINLFGAQKLTAEIPALGARATIFDLNLSKASVSTPSAHEVVVSGVGVTLDAAAAGALDSALGTTLFTAGLPIGTARTDLMLK